MGNGVFPLTVAQRELGIFPAWNKGVHKEVPLGVSPPVGCRDWTHLQWRCVLYIYPRVRAVDFSTGFWSTFGAINGSIMVTVTVP